MNLGDMMSRELGRITSQSIETDKQGESDILKGSVPKTARNQNLGHNSKKEGLGQNIKR